MVILFSVSRPCSETLSFTCKKNRAMGRYPCIDKSKVCMAEVPNFMFALNI